MPPNRDEMRVEAAVDTALQTDLDATTRAILEAWAAAWDRLRPEVEASILALATAAEEGRLTPGMIRRDARLQAALAAVYGALEDLARRTPGIAATALVPVVQSASDGNRDMIRAALSGVLRAELRASVIGADPGQVAAIIERSTQRITARSRALSDEAQAAIRREITRGIVVGENPRRAAARAVRGIEDQWDGGIARAMTIARTEMIDAHRTAAQRTQEANADVLSGWLWHAHVDERTCRACLAQHGIKHALDEPGPLGHPQCRCARVPVTKTWAELGFTGIRDPAPEPTGVELFEAMSVEEQKRILGDDGWAAWKAGDYPPEAWSRRRKADGWRDSFVVTRPPR